jgi:hypothetical protein
VQTAREMNADNINADSSGIVMSMSHDELDALDHEDDQIDHELTALNHDQEDEHWEDALQNENAASRVARFKRSEERNRERNMGSSVVKSQFVVSPDGDADGDLADMLDEDLDAEHLSDFHGDTTGNATASWQQSSLVDFGDYENDDDDDSLLEEDEWSYENDDDDDSLLEEDEYDHDQEDRQSEDGESADVDLRVDLNLPKTGFRIPETYDNDPDHYLGDHTGFYFDSGDEHHSHYVDGVHPAIHEEAGRYTQDRRHIAGYIRNYAVDYARGQGMYAPGTKWRKQLGWDVDMEDDDDTYNFHGINDGFHGGTPVSSANNNVTDVGANLEEGSKSEGSKSDTTDESGDMSGDTADESDSMEESLEDLRATVGSGLESSAAVSMGWRYVVRNWKSQMPDFEFLHSAGSTLI